MLMIDWESEGSALQVIEHAERHLSGRFGGAWFDRDACCINVAMVGAREDDVRALQELAEDTRWRVRVVEVQFSRAELLGFLERLNRERGDRWTDAWATLGWSPEHNCVVAEFRRIDEDAIEFLRERVPAEALRIEIDPGAPYGVALGRDELQGRI
jgi:hypothetical protein